jgi:hypothetical protein
MQKNYAQAINDAKLMIAGLKSNTDKLNNRGLNAEFITKFEAAYNAAQQIDNEQENLKAKLKTKTAELDAKVTELNKMVMDSKKIVKIDIDKSGWKEFGIQDKK